MHASVLLATFDFLHLFEETGKDFPVLVPDLRIDTVTYVSAFHISLNDARSLKLFQVLRGGGLCKPRLLNDITTDTGFSLHKVLKDSDACRMRESLGHRGQFVLFVCE